jgi:hypothetical protein
MTVYTKYAMEINNEYVLAGVELTDLQLQTIAQDPRFFEHTTTTLEEYEAFLRIVEVEVTETTQDVDPTSTPETSPEYNTLDALSDEDLAQMFVAKFDKKPAHNALKATIINKLLSETTNTEE